MSFNKIFKDLKVVELAGVLAGPATGLFFAELGAKVIKIENYRTGGDVTRSWKLPSENPKEKTSAYFYSVNFFKKHVFLDLSKKEDLKKCKIEIEKADVVIVNFKPSDAKKYGLRYSDLKKKNPKLIYAAIEGFSDQPNRLAYDLILQAETGYMSMNGTSKSGPLKMPVALIDVIAAHQLKEAILISLLKREKSNKGNAVTVSLFDAGVSSLVNQASNYLIAKKIPKPTGSLHPNIAPYGEIFETKDKIKITFAIGNDSQFKALCELLDLENLFTDKKYANNQNRVVNRAKLITLLNKKVLLFKSEKLEKECIKRSIPYGRIRDLQQLFELKAAKNLILENHKSLNIKYLTGNAFRFQQ